MDMKTFVRENGLCPGEDVFARWVEGFQSEMTAGLAGQASSLRMIPTYLSADAIPPQGDPVIVLDAGGTNLRVALMEFVPGQGPKQTYFQTVPMLGTKGRLTVDEFYDGLAALMAPIADKSDRVGFCFSFPCEILPNLDGKILHFDKEVDITGAEGSILGDGLRAALERLGKSHNHHLAVINDTVAAMLGAMAQGAGQGSGSYMGFILGTGTNLCASFPNSLITKAPALASKPGSTVINLESGGFDKLERSLVDLNYDATTANPGVQVLEKLLSGAYQGPMVLAYLRAAAEAGLFSPQCAVKLGALAALTARDISEFLVYSGEEGENPLAFLTGADKDAALELLDAFFRRAARLTAATLAAVMGATGQGGDPKNPVNIAAEGTTFYRCPLLHKYLLEDMDALVAKKLHLYSRFVQGENPNLTGAALAALAVG